MGFLGEKRFKHYWVGGLVLSTLLPKYLYLKSYLSVITFLHLYKKSDLYRLQMKIFGGLYYRFLHNQFYNVYSP